MTKSKYHSYKTALQSSTDEKVEPDLVTTFKDRVPAASMVQELSAAELAIETQDEKIGTHFTKPGSC